MFRVENADFIAEKLAAELLPNQEFREVTKNALQAVERRMHAQGVTDGGRVEFDVDWHLHEEASGAPWYLRCADNGDGMSRWQVDRYTTTLAVQGADQKQSIRGNQGMGLKISGPTRHKQGILIRSLQGSERSMVQIGWNGAEYDLIPLGEHDEKVVETGPESFPEMVNQQGSGTVVTFLGNVPGDNTFAPESKAKGWLLKYLNTRFFRLSHDGIEVIVRVPTGGPEDWPNTLEEARERMRGKGRSFNLTKVHGTGELWDEAADRQGEDFRGVVTVPGNAAANIPPADVYWWVLPTGAGTDVSSRTASAGSLAVLYDNELHDWRTSNQANPFFARLGVLFGKNRIAFVIAPQGPTVASDFARAHVLVSGTPVFESDAWLVWAEQFRAQLPERIKQTIAEEQQKLEIEDPDRARRIKDRLHDVMQLLRPRRFRRQPAGAVRATNEVPGAGGGEDGEVVERPIPTRRPPGPRPGRGRGIGAVLSRVVDEDEGEPANEVLSILKLDPRWVTEQEAESLALVNGNGYGLRDRAAALAGQDGRTATVLLLNREFRGFQAILAAVNDWANPEGDEDKAAKIKASAEEWIEQKMIEAVHGLRQLDNGTTWLAQHYDQALNPVALTAAFMADRYHTLAEVKRAVGPLRQTSRTVAAAAAS